MQYFFRIYLNGNTNNINASNINANNINGNTKPHFINFLIQLHNLIHFIGIK